MRIDEMLFRRGLQQKALSRTSGIAPSTLTHILKHGRNMRAESAKAIRDGLIALGFTEKEVDQADELVAAFLANVGGPEPRKKTDRLNKAS